MKYNVLRIFDCSTQLGIYCYLNIFNLKKSLYADVDYMMMAAFESQLQKRLTEMEAILFTTPEQIYPSHMRIEATVAQQGANDIQLIEKRKTPQIKMKLR